MYAIRSYYGHGTLFDWPDRLAGLPIQHEQEGRLGWLCQRPDRAPVHFHIEQYRRARQIGVPDAVVNGLIMPPA